MKAKPSARSPPINPDEFLPRVLSTKMEDGQLKPVYDPDDIKKWKIKKGLLLDEEARDGTKADPRTRAVSLLPVQTGGHDPSTPADLSRLACDTNQHDQNSARLQPEEHGSSRSPFDSGPQMQDSAPCQPVEHGSARPALDTSSQGQASAALQPEEIGKPPLVTTDRVDSGEPPRQPQQKPRESPLQAHAEPHREVALHEQQDHEQHDHGASHVPIPSQPQQSQRSDYLHRNHQEPPRHSESLPRHEPHHRAVSQLPAEGPKHAEAPPPHSGQVNTWVEPRRQSDGFGLPGVPIPRDAWIEPRRHSDNFNHGVAPRPREHIREAETSHLHQQAHQQVTYAGDPRQYEPAGERYQQLAPGQHDLHRLPELPPGGHQYAEVPRHDERPRAVQSAGGRYQHAEVHDQHALPRAHEARGESYQPEAPRQYDPPPRTYHQAPPVKPTSPALPRDPQMHPQAASQPMNYDSPPPGRGGYDPTRQQGARGREDALGWGPPPLSSARATGKPARIDASQITGPPQPSRAPSLGADGPPQPASPRVHGPQAHDTAQAHGTLQFGDFAPLAQVPDPEGSAQTPTPAAEQQTSARAPQPAKARLPTPELELRQQPSRGKRSHRKEREHGRSARGPPPREPSIAPSNKSHESAGGW